MQIIQPRNWRWWAALAPSLAIESASVTAALLSIAFDWTDRRLDRMATRIARWVVSPTTDKED